MLGEDADALVQLAARLAHLLRRLGHALLAPRLRRAPEQRDQVDRAREDHPLRHAAIDQLGVDRERGAKEVLAGKEHHDELGTGLELVAVRLAGESRHVIAHQPRVVLQQPLPHRLVGRLLGVEIRPHHGLGVDHDVAPAREPDHQVRAQAAVVAGDRHLLVEITMIEHARQLDDAPELDLAPAAPHARRPQRQRQRRRLGGKALLRLVQPERPSR